MSDIVQEATPGLGGPHQGPTTSVAIGSNWRFASATLGWVIGVLTLLGGAGGVILSGGYPPDIVTGIVYAVSGTLVLPPATQAIRKRLAPYRLTIAPPAVWFVLALLAQPIGSLVEPHGAERLRFVNRAIALAEGDLASHNVAGAQRRLETFRGDAATNSRLAALLARVQAAQQAEDATRARRAAEGRARADAQAAAATRDRQAREAQEAAGRQAADARARSETAEALQRAQAIAMVRRALRDADSARFGRVLAYEEARNGFHYCGAVNARNGFGGYTGEQAFIAIPPAIVMIDDGSRSFRTTWREICSDTSRAREVTF